MPPAIICFINIFLILMKNIDSYNVTSGADVISSVLMTSAAEDVTTSAGDVTTAAEDTTSVAGFLAHGAVVLISLRKRQLHD